MAGQRDAPAVAERIAHRAFFAALEREVAERARCGQQRLGFLERAERRLARERRDHAAPHPRVELQADAVAVDGGRLETGGVTWLCRKQQNEREGYGYLHASAPS